LQQLQLINDKNDKQNKILLILPNKLNNIFLAGRNLNYLTLTQAHLLNTYLVMVHSNLLFTKEAVISLTQHFLNTAQSTTSPQIKDQPSKTTEKSLPKNPSKIKKEKQKTIKGKTSSSKTR